MRIYFLSERVAALKLNGLYLGTIDLFERHVEMDAGDNVLAEIVPDGNAESLNFFINERFLHNPPSFADVYLMDGDALIHIKKYAEKQAPLKVIAQVRFCNNLVTLYSQGGLYLSCEGDGFEYYCLSPAFLKGSFKECAVGGQPLLILEGEGCILALSASGKKVFENSVLSYETGENLTVKVAFETCAQVQAECTFAYDGHTMTLISSRTEEKTAPDESVLHFAFFESVLTRCDSTKYLCGELQPSAGKLGKFLGDFVGVTVPTEKFFAEHGDIKAAGLVYPVKPNLFNVKYFAAEISDGKITNIFEV